MTSIPTLLPLTAALLISGLIVLVALNLHKTRRLRLATYKLHPSESLSRTPRQKCACTRL